MSHSKHKHCHQHCWAYCSHCNVWYCTVEGCDAERRDYHYPYVPNPWRRPYPYVPYQPYWDTTGNIGFSAESCNHK